MAYGGTRMLRRYCNLNRLNETYLDQVCKGKITMEVGEFLSSLMIEWQNDLVSWGYVDFGPRAQKKLSAFLKKVRVDEAEWTREAVDDALKTKGKQRPMNWTEAGKGMGKVAKKRLSPALLPFAPELLSILLDGFLEENPEFVYDPKAKKGDDGMRDLFLFRMGSQIAELDSASDSSDTPDIPAPDSDDQETSPVAALDEETDTESAPDSDDATDEQRADGADSETN